MTEEELDKKLGLLPTKRECFYIRYKDWDKETDSLMKLNEEDLFDLIEYIKKVKYENSFRYNFKIFFRRIWYAIIFKRYRIRRKNRLMEKRIEKNLEPFIMFAQMITG